MKPLSIAAAAGLVFASVAMPSAASAKDVLKGAAIGAGGGAVAGAVIPGLSVGEGAIIGGVGGAVVGALSKDDKHKWRRDRYGREYRYKDGERHYRN
jgi:hypothetical protein